MPKRTLLDMVQSILSSIDGDEVNSINDTVESLDVASIIKDTYYDIITDLDVRGHFTLHQLNSASSDKPTHMKIPTRVKEIDWVKYDCRKKGDTQTNYQSLTYLYPEHFLRYVDRRNADNEEVEVITDDSGIGLKILNDTAPQYWTSFDDDYVVMDAYNQEVDSFLQNSKTIIFALLEPEWNTDDDFIPDLPVEMFPVLLEESRSVAFMQIKQMEEPKTEQRAQRHRAKIARKQFRAKKSMRYPDYGRKGPATVARDVTFKRRR